MVCCARAYRVVDELFGAVGEYFYERIDHLSGAAGTPEKRLRSQQPQ
jgi:hypothetical protein